MKILTKEQILVIHQRCIEETGGPLVLGTKDCLIQLWLNRIKASAVQNSIQLLSRKRQGSAMAW